MGMTMCWECMEISSRHVRGRLCLHPGRREVRLGQRLGRIPRGRHVPGNRHAPGNRHGHLDLGHHDREVPHDLGTRRHVQLASVSACLR